MILYTGGYLTFYMPHRKVSLELSVTTPTPLKEILNSLHIPLAEVYLVAVNGVQADIEAVVCDADVVRIYSSVNGG